MRFNHTLSAILRGHWMLEPKWAAAHFPLVIAMLQGEPVSFVDRTGNSDGEMPFAVDPVTMLRHELFICGAVNPNIPPNCVAIMPLNGPLTKYNGECGEAGMIKRCTWFMQMQRMNNIGSIIQLIDTPGGEGRASTTYSNLVVQSKKPVLSFVDDMCASLGMWFSSAGDETYLSHDLASVGSIGSYVTIADFTGYYEMQGIKVIDIYAPQSTDKNKDWRDALKGDTSAIEADLKNHVDAFISFVATQRGDKAASNKAAWQSGKMFDSKEAIKIGLADGVMDFDKVVSKAAWLAKRNKN